MCNFHMEPRFDISRLSIDMVHCYQISSSFFFTNWIISCTRCWQFGFWSSVSWPRAVWYVVSRVSENPAASTFTNTGDGDSRLLRIQTMFLIVTDYHLQFFCHLMYCTNTSCLNVAPRYKCYRPTLIIALTWCHSQGMLQSTISIICILKCCAGMF